VEAYRIRNVEEEEISLWKKSMEFPIQSHYLTDISMEKLHHQSIAYITMEWRGQQHAREAVESTDPVPHQQYKLHHYLQTG